jgi:hypothetical protein
MARTTLELPDMEMRRLKKIAAEKGCSLKDLVRELLAIALSEKPKEKFRLRWKTFKGQLQPGVRLEDRDALFDLMEGK